MGRRCFGAQRTRRRAIISRRCRRRAARRHRCRARQGSISRDERASAIAATVGSSRADYRHHELLLDARGEKLSKSRSPKRCAECRAEGVAPLEARALGGPRDALTAAAIFRYDRPRRNRFMPQNIPVFAAPYAPPTRRSRATCWRRNLARRSPQRRKRFAQELLAGISEGRAVGSARRGFLHDSGALLAEGARRMALADIAAAVPDDVTSTGCSPTSQGAWGFRAYHASPTHAWRKPAPSRSGLSARVIARKSRRRIVADLARRLGAPSLRAAAKQAMRLMGSHFVYARRFNRRWSAPRTTAAAIPSTLLAKRRKGRRRRTLFTPTPARSRPLARRRTLRIVGDFRKALRAASTLRKRISRGACSPNSRRGLLELARSPGE